MAEAINICDNLENRNLVNPEVLLLRADLNLLLNKKTEAEKFYREASLTSKSSIQALMKLAIFLKSEGKNQDAEELFDIVKRNSIKSSAISLLMADYYLIDENYEKAEEFLKLSIRLEPKDNNLKYHLIQFYISVKKFDEAERLLLEVLEMSSKDIYLRMMLADIYISKSELQTADAIIEGLREDIKETIMEFELLQGKFWLYSGKTVYATSYLKNAIEMAPGLINVRYFLSLTHLANSKSKLAEQSLTQTLQIDPQHYKALLLLSELLYKKKEYDLALKYIDRVLKSHPEDFSAHIIKGLNLIGKEQYKEALSSFQTAGHINKNKPSPSYYIALTEQLAGNENNAIKMYEHFLSRFPKYLDAVFHYVYLLIDQNKHMAAKRYIEKNINNHGDGPFWNYLAAVVENKLGNLEKCEELLKKALAAPNAPGYAYLELAVLYRSRENFQKAIEILKECTLVHPTFEDGWLMLSKLYMLNNDFESALKAVKSGYARLPGSIPIKNNLALLLIEIGDDLNQALNIARIAYEEESNNAAVADTLGWAYYNKGIYSQAEWLLSEASRNDPDNGFVMYHLGMTYYKQGDLINAKKWLEKSLKTHESKMFKKDATAVLNSTKI